MRWFRNQYGNNSLWEADSLLQTTYVKAEIQKFKIENDIHEF